MATVVLIDDNEVGRAGRRALLEEAGHQVRSSTWEACQDAAVADDPTVDVVLAVVRPDTTTWDRFRAIRPLRVASRTGDRAGPGTAARVVAAVPLSVLSNPMVGLRLANAGVDELVDRDRADTAQDLHALVTGSQAGISARPGRADLERFGLGARSDPDRVVAQILELGAADRSYLLAFEPGSRQNQSGLSRRRAHTLRVKVSEWGELSPRTSQSRGGPVRDWSLPPWVEVVRFVNLCRGRVPSEPDAGGLAVDEARGSEVQGGGRRTAGLAGGADVWGRSALVTRAR